MLSFFTAAQPLCYRLRTKGEARVERALLEFFRSLLLARREEILVEAGRTVGGMSRDREEVLDEIDLGSMEAERTPVLRIRERERKLLSKIDAALARIDAGTYGVCEVCGDEIATERLKARPVTTLCIGCKAEQEDAERRNRSS
jgi:DnaK suppressor protein